MSFRNLIGLLFVVSFCCCSGNQPKQPEKYFGTSIINGARRGRVIKDSTGTFGTSITNGTRRGRVIKDSTGTSYFYCYITTTITNDSLIPMNLKIALSKEYYQPTPVNGQKFKVFLQDSSILSDSDIKRVLIEPSTTLNKVINPKEKCYLHIGFLAESASELNPMPFALFTKGHKPWLGSIPDDTVNQVATIPNQLTLLLGLGLSHTGPDSPYRCYSLIPS